MRIGIDASRANAEQRTGTEWYSFYVIQELKNLVPSDTEVVLYSKETLRGPLADLPENWSSRVLGWPPRFMWTQLRLSWEMLVRRPDLLYVPAHTIPFIHPKKVVLVVHDVGFAEDETLYDNQQIGYKSVFGKRVVSLVVRLFTLGRYGATELDYHRFSMNMAAKAATRILTVSHFSKDRIQHHYNLPSDRVTVVPNGRNPREYKSDPQILERLGVTDPYVLYLGRVEEKKNVGVLIEAFASLLDQVPEAQLVLAGSPGYGHGGFLEAMKGLGISDNVIETGWTSEKDVAALMADAKVFVLPSRYEGFGIPVIEAMDANTPVVCSDIPALREVAGEAALYFDPDSSAECAKQMLDVFVNKETGVRLVEAGAKRREKFSWDRTGRGTWEELQQLLQ